MSDLTIVTGRGVRVPAVVLRFASGATRTVNASLVEHLTVLGLSAAGRIVVDYLPDGPGAWTFGLTLCCNASDTGTDDAVVCRGCYGTRPDADAGEYGADAVDLYVGLDDHGHVREGTL